MGNAGDMIREKIALLSLQFRQSRGRGGDSDELWESSAFPNPSFYVLCYDHDAFST